MVDPAFILLCLGGGYERCCIHSDPRVVSIATEDNKEPLFDLRTQSAILLGPSPEIENNQDYTYLRKSVYQRLLHAQDALPAGLHFILYEGYRSLDLQQALFAARYQELKEKHPKWDHTSLFHHTIKLVSPVILLDGTKNIPPHSTGGALDVYLVDDEGRVVDMGIHPKDWMKDTNGLVSKTKSDCISKTAMNNRAIMSKALKSAGFVNYGGEYWHWSYGDRYWAYFMHKEKAIYGSIQKAPKTG